MTVEDIIWREDHLKKPNFAKGFCFFLFFFLLFFPILYLAIVQSVFDIRIIWMGVPLIPMLIFDGIMWKLYRQDYFIIKFSKSHFTLRKALKTRIFDIQDLRTIEIVLGKRGEYKHRAKHIPLTYYVYIKITFKLTKDLTLETKTHSIRANFSASEKEYDFPKQVAQDLRLKFLFRIFDLNKLFPNLITITDEWFQIDKIVERRIDYCAWCGNVSPGEKMLYCPICGSRLLITSNIDYHDTFFKI